MSKIGWLNNRRYKLPEDTSFLLNDLDAKDEEIARLLNLLADARTESMRLRAALRDCLSWHDYSNDMHKPIEVRAAYMRARAALEGK